MRVSGWRCRDSRGELGIKKPWWDFFKVCGPGRIRTCDQAIMSRQIKALFSQREMDDQDDLE